MIRSMFHRSRDRTLSLSLSPLAREISRRHLTSLSPQKLLDFEQTFKALDGEAVPGDVLTVGADRGCVLLAALAMPKRRFLGFYDPESVKFGDLAGTFRSFGFETGGRNPDLRAIDDMRAINLDSVQKLAFGYLNCSLKRHVPRWLNAVSSHLSAGGVLMLDDHDQIQLHDRIADRFIAEHDEFRFMTNKSFIALTRKR